VRSHYGTSPGKYRWRTVLRTHLPGWALGLAPKGRADCGNHEWYRSEARSWRCYHCAEGLRADPPAEEHD